jgi:hypothetical protein
VSTVSPEKQRSFFLLIRRIGEHLDCNCFVPAKFLGEKGGGGCIKKKRGKKRRRRKGRKHKKKDYALRVPGS